MTAPHPLHVALSTLQQSLFLYGRHIALFTAVSGLPALARIALFLEAPWMSGAVSGIVEGVVGIFRLILFFVAFRLVWTDGFFHLGGALGRAQTHVSWPLIVWQVALLALVPLVLNYVAGLVGATLSADPRVQTAITYGLKNLLIIPFWMVYLLVAIRKTLQG